MVIVITSQHHNH